MHVYSRYLDVLGETFIELLVVLLVFSQFSEELQTLLDDVLANDLEDLALLQHFSGDVEGQVLGVHHTTDKVWRWIQGINEIFRWVPISHVVCSSSKNQLCVDEVIAQKVNLLRYSGMSSSQLSMMKTLLTYSLMLFFFFLFSKRSKGARRGIKSRARNSSWPSTEKCCKKGKEFTLVSLYFKPQCWLRRSNLQQLLLHCTIYLDSQVILPVVGQTLVKLAVLLICDVVGVPGPDGLGLVQLLLVDVLLLDLLCLLLVLVFGVLLII